MIAFVLTIYTAVVLVLFKMKLLKPRPYPTAGAVVAGVLILASSLITAVRRQKVCRKSLPVKYAWRDSNPQPTAP